MLAGFICVLPMMVYSLLRTVPNLVLVLWALVFKVIRQVIFRVLVLILLYLT